MGGQTLNPHGPGTLDVSGSSSGSAAGVALDLAPVAIGTETCGSIISPSIANQIVGLKPTVGLLSRSGIIPLAGSYDTPGPMTKTVSDAALLMNIMAQPDENDPLTISSRPNYTDYAANLHLESLQGAKLAAPLYFRRHPTGRAILSLLQEAGARTELVDFTIPEVSFQVFLDVLLYEFRRDMNHYLKTNHPALGIDDLSDLIRFNKKDPDKRVPYGQDILIKSNLCPLSEIEYKKTAQELRQLAHRRVIAPLFEQQKFDAILGNHPLLCAYASLPAVTVPFSKWKEKGAEFDQVTFVGPPLSEAKLLQFAYAFEQKTRARNTPV
nr:amidase family protein [Lihuaxuella thermophila]